MEGEQNSASFMCNMYFSGSWMSIDFKPYFTMDSTLTGYLMGLNGQKDSLGSEFYDWGLA